MTMVMVMPATVQVSAICVLFAKISLRFGDELLAASIRAEEVVSAVVLGAMRGVLGHCHPANEIDGRIRRSLLSASMCGVRARSVPVRVLAGAAASGPVRVLVFSRH